MNNISIAELERIIGQDYSNIAGMVIYKDGTLCYEKYFHDFSKDSRFHVYSVTKSIVSILLGIAKDMGKLGSLDQRAVDFFPEYEGKKKDKTKQYVTLRNLITMTAPYHFLLNPYVKYFTSADWVKFTLDLLGGRGKIGEFRYAPLIGPDLLTGILAKVTGQSVLDFAREHLFTPLGIPVKDTITFQSKEEQMAFYEATDLSGWVSDSTGTYAGGWGLTLSAQDMVKIGQLYLNGGMWKDRQIVSEQWINESTKEQSRWQKQNLSYGYLWWVCDENSFAAMGDGGNVIYVNKKNRMVIAIASVFKPKVTDRIDFIKAYVEPVFADEMK